MTSIQHTFDLNYRTWPRFQLGHILITTNAQKIPTCEILCALIRHMGCERARLPQDNPSAKAAAVKNGGRLVSEHSAPDGTQFIIVTQANRASTTILLVEEFQ